MKARRSLLLAFGAGALSVILPSLARPEGRVRRIGYLSQGNAQATNAWLAAFREGMLELRWIEGRDYVIDARYANGIAPAIPGLADEMVAGQPDLLLTTSENSVLVLAQRTKAIPIVFAIVLDPVGSGIAASLHRPGGNATGLTTLAGDLSAKRLQLLKEAVPRLAHVGLLFEPAIGGILSQVKDAEEAAVRLGMRVSLIELRQAADIEPAFKRGAAQGVQAYIVTQGGILNSQRQAVVDHSFRFKAPAMFANVEYVEGGGLMSYSASFQDNFRRAAGYVDKILKGARPGDVPIEQPTKFELVLNLKTAKAIGIKFPQSILLRADRVIE